MKLIRIFIIFTLGLVAHNDLKASITDVKGSFLVSTENDPDVFVKNVNVIQGNYAETEVDAMISGPDPLVISRHYNSLWEVQETNLGGWNLFSYCYLFLNTNSQQEEYTTSEGKFEWCHIVVDTEKGDTLSYAAWVNVSTTSDPVLFEIEENLCRGLANSARKEITAWTNQKNNRIYYHSKTQTIEFLPARGGKRIYIKGAENRYLLQQELLPSGNKIFYQYDQGRLVSVVMKNQAEQKVLSWLKIDYSNEVTLTTSDLQTISYQFSKIGSHQLLSTVKRSHKPTISYDYEAINSKLLLTRKNLPDHMYAQIDYEKETQKVQAYTEPLDSERTIAFTFSYAETLEEGSSTTVQGPSHRLQTYHYNSQNQLTQIDDYLEGSLYRVHKKRWGNENDFGNLMAIALEDSSGTVFYFKTFEYNEKGNVLEEREYGNLTGNNPTPILLAEDNLPDPSQECHIKSYTYGTDKEYDYIDQKDIKKNVLRRLYKPGTEIMLGKLILELKSNYSGTGHYCKKRELFHYNDDGVLTRATVDDGSHLDIKSFYDVVEMHITEFLPKSDLPNFGAPEVIDEKYLEKSRENEPLLKRVINHFDTEGNIILQDIIDSEGKHQYSLRREYDKGLLTLETDPESHETTYTYDSNYNLRKKIDHAKGMSYEYDYDLSHHCTRIVQKGSQGEYFESTSRYDEYGHLISEIDLHGHETLYHYDELGRLREASYPPVANDTGALTRPVYTYSYDLFDNITLIKDPKGQQTLKAYTVRQQPTWIQYPDGTEELFKYDTEGTLHRHRTRDGTTSVFEYDYLGRLMHKQRYPRGNSPNERESVNEYWEYDTFHLKEERNVRGEKTTYSYDRAGRLSSRLHGKEKLDYQYDSLNRVHLLKKWKTDTTFTLETRKYNLLNQILEKSLENDQGKVLLRSKWVYTQTGQLQDVIGYPNNQETVLTHYQYDGIDRLKEITCGTTLQSQFDYDNHFINEFGQKVLKVTCLDPFGTKTENIFDTSNRPVSITKTNKAGVILYQKHIQYDLVGHKTSEDHLRAPNSTLAKNYVIHWNYEKGDQLATLIQAEGTPEENTQKLGYNAYGDLTSLLLPASKTPITYDYKELGFLKRISFNTEGEKDPTAYEFKTDEEGYVTEGRYPKIYTTQKREWGRLKSENYNEKYWNGPEYTVTGVYDGEGLITSLTLPDGSSIEYTYDGPLVIQIIRKSKEKAELYKHRITSYDLMGNILEEILPFNGGSKKQFWDHLGRRIGITTDFFHDKIPENGYDALSRLKLRETTLGKSKTSHTYEYDDLSQLISEQGDDTNTYTYDSLENRLTNTEETYKINDFNQLIEGENTSYSFDPNGNLATKGTASYGFNPLGQLSTFKDTKENKVTFTCDIFGRRLSKKIETKDKKVKTYRYFYFGDFELGCIDETGAITELKIPLNPNQPKNTFCIAFELKKIVFVPLYDLQGNVACLINPKQRKIVESYKYTAFGVEHIYNENGKAVATTAIGNPWRYLGKRVDSETDLVYFGRRYYDPSIGRWISPDPLGPQEGPNVYAFVHNNPFLYTDTLGLEAEPSVRGNKEFLSYFHGEYEPHCACERHRECRRGGEIGDALGGALLGGVKFGFSTLRGLVNKYGVLAMEDFLEDLPPSQREIIRAGVEESWEEMEQTAKDTFAKAFEIDATSPTTLTYEQRTNRGLIVFDYLRGNFKNPKQAFSALRNPIGIEKITGVKGWKVGDSIKNLTKRGNVPKWSTVRARYWKNRALWAKSNSNDYGPANIARMEKGLAPRQFDDISQEWRTMELHHDPARRDGGLFDFIEVWPEEHAELDRFRRLGG